MSIRLALALTSLALVTACGTAGPAGSTGSGGSTGSSGESDATSPTDGAGVGTFPVTISRTGGIAGFNDRIVVATGGATTVTSKRGDAGNCTLTADTVTRLLGAVSSMPKASASPTGPRIADEMFTTVEAPSTAGPVRLTDATSPDLAVVGEIIADVTGASPAYRLCTKA